MLLISMVTPVLHVHLVLEEAAEKIFATEVCIISRKGAVIMMCGWLAKYNPFSLFILL